MHILLFILCFEILFSEWKIDIYLFIHFKYQLQFPLPRLHPLPLNPLLWTPQKGLSFGVNKAWYIRLRQDQASLPHIKAEQNISQYGMGFIKLVYAPGIDPVPLSGVPQTDQDTKLSFTCRGPGLVPGRL